MERKINPEDVKVIDTSAEDFPAGVIPTVKIKTLTSYKKKELKS